MKRKNWITIILLVLVVLISYKLYQNKKTIDKKNKPAENSAQIRIPVVADTVKLLSLDQGLKKTCNLAPYKEAIVYAATSGNIENINFELGSRVLQGQTLAVTDTRKLQLDLQKAVASEKKLKEEVQTYNELLAGKAATKEKVNQLSLDYKDAQNQSLQIRKQLYDTKILAPISGVISEKEVEKGVYVNAGTKLGKVVDLRQAKVQVYLTESEVYQVKEKDAVSITSDIYPDKKFIGILSYISPQADATHSYLAEITFNNPQDASLRSGTFVYASFTGKKTQPALVIPREALLENTTTPTVYVIVNDQVTQRTVRTGKDLGGFIEILSGLREGELIVTSGQINLKDKSLIAISNKKAKK